jgi:flagellar M-ring protein FliF
MNLLSEGLFDEKGKVNSTNSSAVDIARNAEKGLSKDLEKSIVNLLEPIFGKGKVKATVNADLNFDSSEKTELIVDPNKVIKNESRSDNKSIEEGKTGGAVDNNMNNVGNGQKGTTEAKEEKIEYEVGKVETKTVKAQGELNKITASVAIDGDLDSGTIKNVKDMVSNTIGIQKDRGDDVAVVGMNFGMNDKPTGLTETQKMEKMLKTTAYVVGGLLLLIAIAIMIMFIIKKRNKNKDDEFDENSEIDMINQKLEEMENNRLNNIEEDEESITLEEEVKIYASENPDQVTELINSWLNE